MDNNGLAYADGTALPTRYGTWFFGNGIVPTHWVPADTGRGAEWVLSTQLEPLAAHKASLSLATGHGFDFPDDFAHYNGAAGILTGKSRQDFTVNAPSIDQLVAAVHGRQTPYSSLEVGVSRSWGFPGTVVQAISHTGPYAPNYPEWDPNALFERLFGVSALDPRVRDVESSVLDAVLGDLNSLQRQVGREDQERLEANADGIRGIERRLQEFSAAGSAQCSTPVSFEEWHPGVTSDSAAEAPRDLNRAMAQMTAMALACDLTNVLSFAFTTPGAQVYYRELGSSYDLAFHDNIVHSGTPHDDSGLVTGGVRYTMEAFAVLLDELASVPDGDGTLLDSSLILATSCIGRGWDHDYFEHPILLAGKARGRVRGDVHVRPDGRPPATAALSTIAAALQLDSAEFGDENNLSTAEISGILT